MIDMNGTFTHTYIPIIHSTLNEYGFCEIANEQIDALFPHEQHDPVEVLALAMSGNRQPSAPQTQEQRIQVFCREHNYRWQIDPVTRNLKLYKQQKLAA